MASTASFDIRNDEEQGVKLVECVELLTVAGYFRARSRDLPPFDKIVGGLSWCIAQCSVDRDDLPDDIDLLYSEHATIGQKISLTERIVRILPLLRCPHAIEPHQIQGLDFVHIFPVIQWAVKSAVEARQARGDTALAFAQWQYDRASTDQSATSNDSIRVLSDLASVVRRYKRRDDRPSDVDDLQRVNDALFEYDGVIKTVGNTDESETQRDTDSTNDDHLETCNELSADAIQRLIDEPDGRVRRVALGQDTSEDECTRLERLVAELSAQSAVVNERLLGARAELDDAQAVHGQLDAEQEELDRLKGAVDPE